MKRDRWTWFSVGLAAGLLGGALLVRRRDESPRVPYLDIWQDELAKTRGAVNAGMLAACIQAHYADLYARRPRFANRALRWRVREGILPGLALYQALREEHITQEAALAETEALFALAYKGPSALFPLLKRLPDPFAAFRAIGKWMLRRGLPDEGWEMTFTEDSADCLAFEVRNRCLYRDVLAAFGAPELTPIFCKMDDLTFAQLAPEILYTRTQTLGRGDDRCDFRYCRGKPEAISAGSKTDIRHLSPIAETLVLPLCYRAMETQRPDALIHDPKAAEIVAQLAHDFTRIKRQRFQQLNVALRVREFDRSTRAFLAHHPDGVVVDIGCGLDTRFERVDNGRVRWFNLDLPEVIALRDQFLPPIPRCRYLASSALDFGWMEAAAEAGGPYLFLCEGVLPYFTQSEVKELVLALRERFPGSEFVFDAVPPLMARFGRLHPAIRQTRAARARWGLDDSRALERWGLGLRLLADWRYYAQDEPRLGWYRWLRYVPVVRDFRVLHYMLGDKVPQPG